MIDLTVKTLDSQNHAFNVDENITVAQFKQKVFEKINIPVETQRIIYCGRVLKDDHKLSEYDLNGKVVHLVQRAPPSTGPANSTNAGQRRSRSISPSAQHRRRSPRGNTMYVGSMMSFPANFVEGFIPPPPPPLHTLAASRLNVARGMLSLAEARLAPASEQTATVAGVSAASAAAAREGPLIEMQVLSGDLQSAIDWFDNVQNDLIDEPLPSSTPPPFPASSQSAQQPPGEDGGNVSDSGGGGGGEVTAQHAVVDVVEVAFVESDRVTEPTVVDQVEIVIGPGSDIPSIDPDDSNMVEVEDILAPSSEHRDAMRQQLMSAVDVETQTAAAASGNSEAPTDGAARDGNNSNEPTAANGAGSSTENAPNQNATARSDISRTSAMAAHLDTLQRIHQNFAPLLERYHQFMRDDPVIAPEDIDSTQSMLEQVSDVLHLLGHAYHSLSDIIVRAYATPPRALLCCPILVQSGVMHSSLPLPIQLEAQINFNHNNATTANNTPRNNTSASGGGQPTAQQTTAAAGTQGANQPTATRIGIPIDANALTAQLAPILASVAAAVQQQQQQQQTTTSSAPAPPGGGSVNFSPRLAGVYASPVSNGGGGNSGSRPLYRMQSGSAGLNGLNNVEYSFELLDDLPVDVDLATSANNARNGQQRMTADGGGRRANNTTQSQQSTSADATTTTAISNSATTCSGSNSAAAAPPASSSANGNNGRGQNSQARGNTATNPTTTQATRTRSTSRPQVHISAEHAAAAAALGNLLGGHHGHTEPLFDPYLRCSSHHLDHQRSSTRNNNNNAGVGGPVLAAGHVQVQMHGPRRLGGHSGRARVRGQTGTGANTTGQPEQQPTRESAIGASASNTSSPSHQSSPGGGGGGTPALPGLNLNAAIYQMAQGLMDNIQTVFAGRGGTQEQPASNTAAPTENSNSNGPQTTGSEQQQQPQDTRQPDWLRTLLDTFGGGEREATANQPVRGEGGVENAGGVPHLLSQAVGRMVRDLQESNGRGGGGVPASGSILIDQGGIRFGDMLGLLQQQAPSRNQQQQRQSGSFIDSFYSLIRRNLTLQDIFSLSTGNLDILQRFRGDIRSIVSTQLLNNSSTPEAIDRGVNILLNDFRPYLDTLSFMTPTDDIDIVASVTSLVRARLPNILQLAASPRTDNSRALADQLRTTVQQMVALVIHINVDGVPGLERCVEHNVNQILRNFPEDFRRTTLQDLHQRFVAPFTAQSASVPNSLLQPYLVRRDAVRSSAASTVDATIAASPVNCQTAVSNVAKQTMEAMDVDVEPEVCGGAAGGGHSSNVEPEDDCVNNYSGPEGWQNQVPQDWVPIISRDVHRQQQSTRRPSSNSNSNQSAALSDAYLSGMPSKRRKLVTDAKPQLHTTAAATNGSSSASLQRVIGDGVRRAVTHTVAEQRGDVEGVAEEVGGDVAVQAAYRDLVRASVAASVRGNVDLTEERFPNACKYFMSSSEVNKPNVP